jgi:hypothetical protein
MAAEDHTPVIAYEPLLHGARGPYPHAQDLWDAWCFAAMEAEMALRGWLQSAQALKSSAFATYRAALDREERAATALAVRIAPEVGARLEAR